MRILNTLNSLKNLHTLKNLQPRLATRRTWVLGGLLAGTLALAPLTATVADSLYARLDHVDVVRAGYTDRYTHTFRGGERALVAAEGDGDIDLQILDENGHVVAEDRDLDSTPVCAFQPRWTGMFTIRVINSEGYPVRYRLMTN